MPYAEIIFEPGSKSVLNYEDEDELKGFITEHVRRAKAGEVGGPANGPAERITKVFTYNEHPADLNAEGKVSTESLNALIEGMAKEGKVSAAQLTEAIRDEVSPVYPIDQGRHESMYKMSGTPFSLDFLEGGAE